MVPENPETLRRHLESRLVLDDRNLTTIAAAKKALSRAIETIVRRTEYIETPPYLAGREAGTMLGPVAGTEKVNAKDLGEGLIIENETFKHSTLQQDKQAKVIILPGYDFNGRNYARKIKQQMHPLLQGTPLSDEQVLVHHYSVFGADGVSTNLARMESIRTFLDPASSLTPEPYQFVKKYILPRFFDTNGRLLADPVKSGNLNLTLLCHSYGTSFAGTVEKALEKILTEEYARYGFAADKPPYNKHQLDKIFSSIYIVGLGAPLHIVPDDKKRLRFSTVSIYSLNDILTLWPEACIRAFTLKHRNMKRPYVLAHDPSYPQCINLLLRHVPASTSMFANMGGHNADAYTVTLTEKPLARIGNALKKIISGDRSKTFAQIIGSNIPPMELIPLSPAEERKGIREISGSWVESLLAEETALRARKGTGADDITHPLHEGIKSLLPGGSARS